VKGLFDDTVAVSQENEEKDQQKYVAPVYIAILGKKYSGQK